MKKKTLVSILAMASAPMAGYADANLDQIKTDAATDWTGASDLKLDAGVFVSPTGLTISQNIGTLVPGTYELTTTTAQNAIITVNGQKLDENNRFTLDTAVGVIIRIESNMGGEFRVGGFQLKLIYNFAEKQNNLLGALAKVQVKINQEAADAADLNERVSKLSGVIRTIVDDAENSYQLYKDFELYKGWENSTVMADIKELETIVDKQAENANPYMASKKIGEEKQAALDEVKAEIAAITDKTERDYTTNITATARDAVQARIDKFLGEALAAYEEGNAANVCTSDFNAAFVADVDDLIGKFKTEITDAGNDHDAYVEVSGVISTLKDTYNKSLQEVYDALAGTETHPDVYEKVRQEAQAKMNEQYVDILEVEKINGTSNDHRGAYGKEGQTLTDNKAELNRITTAIRDLKEEYCARAKSLKDAYTNALALLNGKDGVQDNLDDVSKMDGVSELYQNDIDAIQQMIDGFEAQIKADNENNTIDKVDYKTTIVANINKAIENLIVKAVGSTTNYKAYKDVKDLIAKVQKSLNDTKTAVNALKSTDGKYSVNGKYTAKETEIQTALDNFSTEISEALKDKNDNNACVTWKENNETEITELNGDISEYKKTAEEGVAAYNAVAAALKSYDDAIKALETKVGSEGREVAVYDRTVDPWVFTDETYGSRIDAFKAVRVKIDNKIQSAINDKVGEEHHKLLKEAQTLTTTEGATLVADAATLTANFDGDKAQYDKDVVDIAVDRLLAQANANIKVQEDSLAGWEEKYTQTTLGLAFANLQTEYERLESALNVEKERIPDDPTIEADKAGAMALLADINTRLVTIKANVETLLANARAAVKKVNANNEALEDAGEVVDEIDDQLNGNGTSVPKGVLGLNEDDKRDDEFTQLVTSLTTKIGEQKKAIDDSYKKETLVTDWAGINEKLSGIRQEVMNARTAAENSTANRKAYDDLQTLIANEKIEANIAQAKMDVPTVTDGASETYYLGLITKYDESFSKIKAAIEKAYGTDRNCVDQKGTFETQLKNLNTQIKAVKVDAENNEKAYKAHLDGDKLNETVSTDNGYNDIYKYWEETYADISLNDQTSIVDQYLNRLNVVQTELTKYKTQIEDYYAKGQSYTSDGTIKARLAELRLEIQVIKGEQEAGYGDAVTQDNADRMQRVNDAMKEARETYSIALETIAGFSGLQNEAFISMVSEAVNTANTAINGYLIELRNIESEANAAYEATLGEKGKIFDEDEDYRQGIEKVKADIDAALDVMDAKVDAKARPYFQGEYNDHLDLLTAARTEFLGDETDPNRTDKGLDFNKSVVDNAFADVQKILDDAQADLKAARFLPLVIDGHLNKFETIEGLIEEAKEVASQNEWVTVIQGIEDTNKTNLENLSKWEYADDPYQEKKNQYITDYKQAVTDYIEPAKEYFKKVTDAEEPLYRDNIEALKNYISEFKKYAIDEPDGVYYLAETEWNKKDDSNAAYDEILKMVGDVRAQWSLAYEFVSKYVATEPSQTLITVDQAMDDLLDEAAEWRELGSCTTKKAYAENVCNSNKTKLVDIYSSANLAEQAKINNEFAVLRGEQNKAADAVEGTGNEAAVDAYIKTIDDLEAKFAEAIKTTGEIGKLGDEQAKQEKYLEYENEIARIRAELAAYYNDALESETLEALNAQAAKIEADWNAATDELNAMHQPVIDKFKVEMAAVGTSLEVAKADIQAQYEAGRILLYNDNLTFDMNAIAAELAQVKAEAEAAEKPYDINDEVYAKLMVEIAEVQDSLDKTVEKWNGYIFLTKAEKETIQNLVKTQQELIDEDTKAVEDDNAKWILNENSALNNKAMVERNISTSDRSYTYRELQEQINHDPGQGESSDLRGLWAKYYAAYDLITASGKLYMPEDEEMFDKALEDLENAVKALDVFNKDAFDGTIYKDIEGNPLYDENEVEIPWKRIDYLKEAVPQIWDRIAELTSTMEALVGESEEKAYILGDVNRDGAVLVNDYTQIINYVLGVESVEPGTMVFYAADVNADGKINIGDVTSVTNRILTGRTSTYSLSSLRARGAVDRTIATTDAVVMDMTEEGGIKRIAIRLNNTVNYAGLQLDVHLPAGVTVMNETLGDRVTDHQLYSNTMTDGTHRIVVSSMQNSEFNNTEDALIYLEVSGKAASQITVSDVLASDAHGTVYSIGGQGGDGTTGINGVQATQSLKQRIYSVGGQVMQKLTRGLNIIQNSDGTTKKVLKK